MITYAEALDYIYNLTKYGIKLGLKNITYLLFRVYFKKKGIKYGFQFTSNNRNTIINSHNNFVGNHIYNY